MTTHNWSIARVDWQREGDLLAALRREVFIDEQGVSQADEWDGRDEEACHFALRGPDGTVLGTARVLRESTEAGPAWHIGRVAIARLYRRRGLGGALLRHIIDWCHQREPDTPVYLNAQSDRLAFYQRLGFTVRGDEFMDAGIAHRQMWLDGGQA